jgi:hypothetical protein
MSFIQTLEFTTDRIDDVEAVMDKWVAQSQGRRRVDRALLTADRDNPKTYIQIVEFPSYTDAMENSALPETTEFAAELAELCDGTVRFRNLDLRRSDDLA